MGAVPLLVKTDPMGRVFGFGMIAICAIAGLVNLWLAKVASTSDTISFFPKYDSASEEASKLRKGLWVVLLAFPLISAWIADTLHRVETGAEQSARVWAPVAFVYNAFGYWPAVMTVPVIGVLCAISGVLRLRKLGVTATNQSAEPPDAMDSR